MKIQKSKNHVCFIEMPYQGTQELYTFNGALNVAAVSKPIDPEFGVRHGLGDCDPSMTERRIAYYKSLGKVVVL